MNLGAGGRHRGSGGLRRISRRVVGYPLLAVLLGVGGLGAAIAGRTTGGGSVAVIGATLILLMSMPLTRTVRRLAGNRRQWHLTPSGPPIEQLACDLRRLLWRHEQLSRSSDPVRARWVKPLEAAISSPAIKAARALEVPYLDPPPYNGLDTEELRRLLRALAAEGLVLPTEVRLLAPGGPH